MKKTIMAVIAAAAMMAGQAQAYFPILPAAAAMIGGNQIGNAISDDKAKEYERRGKAITEYTIDSQMMDTTEAMAKNCLTDLNGVPCQTFVSNYQLGDPVGIYADTAIKNMGKMCDHSRSWRGFVGITSELCEKIGYPNDSISVPIVEDKVSFDPMDGNWD